MSHYTVLVMSDSEADVEDLLAPFNENLEVERYVKATKEELIEGERKDIISYRDGNYAEFLGDIKGYKEKYGKNEGHIKYLEEDFPKRLANLDNDDFLYQEAIKYYEEEDINEDGSVSSTYNPKSKWDWYVEGGRWSGSLRLKDGSKVDSAYASEIDFSPDEEEAKRYARIWDLVVEGFEPKNQDERDTLRWNNKEYILNKFKTKGEYVKINSAFHTYAVLTPDGEWHEPGKMGWFGMSHATNEQEIEWYNNYSKFVEEAIENNWLITVVDCHI